MGCCGQKRVAFRQQNHQLSVQQKISITNSTPIIRENVPFKYLGTNALTIKGTITAKRYRLRFMGDIVSVDHRDVPSLMAEPFMEKVKEK